MLENDFFKPLFQYVGIDFGRRDIGVSQQLLDCAQIRAAIKQMAGEGVAQNVRRDALGIKAGGYGRFFQILGEALPCQMAFGPSRGKEPLVGQHR